MKLVWYFALCVGLIVGCMQYGWSNEHNWTSYFQIRYTNAEDLKGYLALRRFKLYGQGPFARGWQYYVQLLYKTNNRSATDGLTLQEFSLIKRLGRARITVGQFKPPFGMERFTSDWKLAVIDRTQATDRLVPCGSLGDSFARGRGIQWEADLGATDVALGVFDGNGANQRFAGNGPLVVGRAIYESSGVFSSHLHFEAASAWRRDRDIDFTAQLPGAPDAYRHFRGRDLRSNVALSLERAHWSMRFECFRAHYSGRDFSIPDRTADGYYMQFSRAVSSRAALAARYEVFDPDTSSADYRDIAWLTLGMNWYIRGDLEKVQVNYIFKREELTERDNDALLIQYQRFF
ncbi:MAG: porin [Armatimonadota bacterium]|nr:porin [Armatimonadota bacterium]